MLSLKVCYLKIKDKFLGNINFFLIPGLTYSTLSLLSTVVFLLVATHLNGWKLDKRLGIVLMFWYLLFITIASLYELNVFGQLNPPECSSKFNCDFSIRHLKFNFFFSLFQVITK